MAMIPSHVVLRPEAAYLHGGRDTIHPGILASIKYQMKRPQLESSGRICQSEFLPSIGKPDLITDVIYQFE
jgi:hypothetical protein